MLYEFQFRDPDESTSLIARIPISFIGEFNESTNVTDDLVRWDEHAADLLEVRRRGRRVKQVNTLALLAFLPNGFDGDTVTLTATLSGVTRQKSFASLRAFHDAFALETARPERPLAELNGNAYDAGVMVFPNADFPDPLLLASGADLLAISYAAPSLGAGNAAVIYLRAM